MALLWSEIQSLAQFHSKDSNLTITSGQGLLIGNQVLATLCLPDGEILGNKIGRRWRELTVVDDSITSVASQEDYDYPKLPVVVDEPNFFYVDVSDSNFPWPILAAPDEGEWAALQSAQTGIPTRYRLYTTSSGLLKLSLRPNPDTAGDTIRIQGIRQPDEMQNGNSKTPFRLKQVDRALAMLIAAEIKNQRDEPQYAANLVAQAIGMLPKSDYAPRQESGRIRPWGDDSHHLRMRY